MSKIYIICHVANGERVGPVKVGIAADPAKRLKQLQIGSAGDLTLAHVHDTPNREIARFLEANFHAVMKEHRLRGEWFDMPPGEANGRMFLNFLAALKALTSLTDDQIDSALRLAGFDLSSERPLN